MAFLSFCWLYFGRDILEPNEILASARRLWRTSLCYLSWGHCFGWAASACPCILQLWYHERVTVMSRGEHQTWSRFYKQETSKKSLGRKREEETHCCVAVRVLHDVVPGRGKGNWPVPPSRVMLRSHRSPGFRCGEWLLLWVLVLGCQWVWFVMTMFSGNVLYHHDSWFPNLFR